MDSNLIFKAGIVKKREKNFQLLSQDDLLTYFVINNYKDTPVLVIYDVNKYVDEIPRLKLLKRDNFKQYLLCEEHEILIASFHSINDAFDYISSLSPKMDNEIKWRILFNHHIVYQGKV